MRTIIVNTEGPRGSAGPVGPQGNPGPSGSGGFLFPETYGASGDGITNDTNALQNVFSASRSTQTPVYLKNIIE